MMCRVELTTVWSWEAEHRAQGGVWSMSDLYQPVVSVGNSAPWDVPIGFIPYVAGRHRF